MVAFVRDNNLFIKDLVSGEENMVTDDGKAGHIINGTTDWVYEEEFGFTKGFSWSPDGSKIAYYRFDESDVMEYGMQMWGELYPEIYRYKYPKAGEKNSLVSIHVYDLEGKSSISVDLGDETDQYIPRIEWTLRPDILAIQRMNRLQNHLEILLADAVTGKTRVTYNENNRYYIEITDHLTFTDRDHFIITSETDGYCHIYYHHLDNGPVGQLTKGEWDVTDVLGYDHKRKRVIFEAARSSTAR